MPDTERTPDARPIPLRDNHSAYSAEQPNPYSRLEAVDCVRLRMTWLADRLSESLALDAPGRGRDVATEGLVEVLDEFLEDLQAALWRDLAAVERVRRPAIASDLLRLWEPCLWPPALDASEPGQCACGRYCGCSPK